jgi:integrase/recombinase XerD
VVLSQFEGKILARERRMKLKPSKETAPTSWTEAVDRFITRCRERNKSPKTIRCYREELLAYAGWAQTEFDEPPQLGSIMESDLASWMSWLQAQDNPKLQPATINKKRASLKSFLRWSETRGFSDPIEMPEAVSMDESALRWLSKNEEHALVRAVDKEKDLRDRALIMFFLRCGVRIEEASTLRLSSLKLQTKKGWATIQGKGAKQREVPIDCPTTKLLNELIGTIRDSPDKDPHVFQGQRGGLSANALHRIVVRYAELAKLPGVTAHCLRHTCAKRLLETGSDITEVQKILGHSNLNTTGRYLKPGRPDLEKSVARRAGTVVDTGDEAPSLPTAPPRRGRRG